jgi:hypothetical protein
MRADGKFEHDWCPGLIFVDFTFAFWEFLVLPALFPLVIGIGYETQDE